MSGIQRQIFKVVSVVLLFALACGIAYMPMNINAQAQQQIVFKKNENSYDSYMNKYKNAKPGEDNITIPAASYISFEGTVENSDSGVVTGDDSELSWNFSVSSEGLYNLEVDYFPTISKGGSIERTVMIDGIVPYSEASFIEFSRVYTDGEVTQNAKGNDVTPEQIESPRRLTYTLCDPEAVVAGALCVYLEAGEHTLSLIANKEKLELFEIRFVPAKSPVSYSEYIKEHKSSADAQEAEVICVEAENMTEKSSSTIYPVSDKSSSSTYPQDPVKTRLNIIDGGKWGRVGQWITWTFNVEKDGFYKIAPRYKQDAYFGGFVSRSLKIDGQIPFKEAEKIRFDYTSAFSVKALGDDNGEFSFYLTSGEHTMTMQVVIGDMDSVIIGVKSALDALNTDYRRILMITGPSPDIYRDYGYENLIPEVLDDFKAQTSNLEGAIKNLNEISNTKGDFTNSINKLIIVLKQIEKDPEMISELFSTYKENLASLGTWIQNITAQPLTVDRIYIVPDNSVVPSGNNSFFSNLWFKIKKFILSFGEDYQSFASEITEEDYKNGNVVSVWMTTGREQSQIMQRLTEQYFTPESNIKINVQLVAATALLPAALAGTGPDVAMNVPSSTPIDFAIRDAAVDLKQFEGFEDVRDRFHPAAMTPFTFSGNVYAIPETMTFLMMFYRTDIFEELGLKAPQTWDEFYEVIWELQQQNLDVGFPINAKTSVVSNLNLYGVELFLYQRGGSVYNKDFTASAMGDDLNVECFEKMAELFTLYKFPVDYDFANRFRSGEMPLGIQEYSMYNQLTIFASEIKGSWAMAPVPGTVKDDGSIDHTSPAASSGIMLLKGAQDYKKSWEFIKWVTSTEIQSKYAKEVESVLGTAAKHATANTESLNSMSWTQAEYSALESQFAHLQGTPEIPGGYYTVRGIDFAFADVYASGKNPANSLLNQVTMINEEIARKRKEFGLDQ